TLVDQAEANELDLANNDSNEDNEGEENEGEDDQKQAQGNNRNRDRITIMDFFACCLQYRIGDSN
ncbi:hypothetical protein BGZ97_009372, partial [Linnemannia gamsii]